MASQEARFEVFLTLLKTLLALTATALVGLAIEAISPDSWNPWWRAATIVFLLVALALLAVWAFDGTKGVKRQRRTIVVAGASFILACISGVMAATFADPAVTTVTEPLAYGQEVRVGDLLVRLGQPAVRHDESTGSISELEVREVDSSDRCVWQQATAGLYEHRKIKTQYILSLDLIPDDNGVLLPTATVTTSSENLSENGVIDSCPVSPTQSPLIEGVTLVEPGAESPVSNSRRLPVEVIATLLSIILLFGWLAQLGWRRFRPQDD